MAPDGAEPCSAYLALYEERNRLLGRIDQLEQQIATAAGNLKPLTGRQREALQMLVDWTDQHGKPPLIREFGHILGIRYTAARAMLDRLAEKGWIKTTPFERHSTIVLHRPT